MPLRLRASLERHIPKMRVTGQTRNDRIVQLDGHMEDLSPHESGFRLAHFEDGRDFYASVKSTDTPHGRQTLDRFKGAFGPGSEEPRFVHTGSNNVGYEFWSPGIHDHMAVVRPETIKKVRRRIEKMNY